MSRVEPAFALIDCNSFYASCERVFRPDLARTPIVVFDLHLDRLLRGKLMHQGCGGDAGAGFRKRDDSVDGFGIGC